MKLLRINGTLIAEGELTVAELANLNRSNLNRANLVGANLDWANLNGANLDGANLNGANLVGASLDGANLNRANLNRANLVGANLDGANLDWANLDWANLNGANLNGANLNGANLNGANLNGANLNGANLVGTCLDHNAVPNGFVDWFETDGEFVIGYRTRKAGHIDQYRDGRFYSADFFSVAETECHPGLYLWPSLQMAKDFSGTVEFIRVRTRPSEVHKAGTKWRCRWFEVIGKAE